MIGAMLLAVFGIGIAIIFISMRKTAAQITKPLEMLNDTAQQLAEGNAQCLIQHLFLCGPGFSLFFVHNGAPPCI